MMRARSFSRRTRLLLMAVLAAIALGSCSVGGAPEVSDPSTPSPAPGSSSTAKPVPPPPAPGSTRLAVVGDFGVGNEDERAVARMMEAVDARRPFDAFLTFGDNVYPSAEGGVRAAWTRPYGWVERRGLDVIATLGDEDVDLDGTGRTVMRALGMPDRWYLRRVGPVDVLALDATQGKADGQRAWIRRTLASTDAPFTIALMHYPPNVCSKGRFESPTREWVELFAEGGVDLVVSGNHHSYQRFAPQNGVTYVIAGIGGAPLHDVTPGNCTEGAPKLRAFDDETNGFLELGVGRDRLFGQAIAADGSVIDEFVVRGGE